ncbi:MAG: peptide-methionine (S)-S-oxide reductase MsrA [Nanoarchaeota archaeon]
MKTATAIFAAGCFWAIQGIFDQIKGVLSTEVGYTGGKKEYRNPTYQQVCSGNTEHAEAVKIIFDEKIVSYEKLLDFFFMNHDPTQLNGQGFDIGSQYRSVIFFMNQQQKNKAVKSKKQWQKKFDEEIMTEIVKAKDFYPAEDYHQKYYLTHGISCHVKMK